MIPRFRAWDSVEKKFVEHFFITDNSLICNMEKPTSDRKLPIPIEKSELILMQSTGLEDKNGKEIFEGDILCDEGIEQESEFVYVTVSYREGMWVCDQITDELCGYGGALNEFNNDYSIIGNIYENPELLEDK